jgi:hypothetical protein
MSVLDLIAPTNKLDFKCIEFVVAALHIEAVGQVNYEGRVERGELRGTSPFVLGTTRGSYSANGSMSIYIEDMQKLRAALMLLPGPGIGYMEKKFLILVTYAEPLSGVTIVDTLEDVQLVSERSDHSQGNDPLMIQCDIFIRKMKLGGFIPITDNTGIP